MKSLKVDDKLYMRIKKCYSGDEEIVRFGKSSRKCGQGIARWAGDYSKGSPRVIRAKQW